MLISSSMGYDKINDVLYCKECGEVGGFEEIHQFKAACWASELVCSLLYHETGLC